MLASQMMDIKALRRLKEGYSPIVATRPKVRILPDSHLNLVIPNGQRSGNLVEARFGNDHHSIIVFANAFTKVQNIVWKRVHGCSPVFSAQFVPTNDRILCPPCLHFN